MNLQKLERRHKKLKEAVAKAEALGDCPVRIANMKKKRLQAKDVLAAAQRRQSSVSGQSA